jgi:molybdopterin converting factor small subunit
MATLIPPHALAQALGTGKLELEAATVAEMIQLGVARYGEPFREALRGAAIVVNGRSINALQGKRTPLCGRDTVWLVRPAGGG